MFSLPLEVQAVLVVFAPLFTKSVWQHATVLAIGSILCIGKRTVTSTLKVMGLKDDKRFTNYHRVLNRAKWNTLNGAKILICCRLSAKEGKKRKICASLISVF